MCSWKLFICRAVIDRPSSICNMKQRQNSSIGGIINFGATRMCLRSSLMALVVAFFSFLHGQFDRRCSPILTWLERCCSVVIGIFLASLTIFAIAFLSFLYGQFERCCSSTLTWLERCCSPVFWIFLASSQNRAITDHQRLFSSIISVNFIFFDYKH